MFSVVEDTKYDFILKNPNTKTSSYDNILVLCVIVYGKEIHEIKYVDYQATVASLSSLHMGGD